MTAAEQQKESWNDFFWKIEQLFDTQEEQQARKQGSPIHTHSKDAPLVF